MILENLSLSFEKWKSYAGLYQEMEGLRKKVVTVKYSDKGSFDLDNFNGKKFSNKAKLCDSPDGLWENYTTYSFNLAALPVIEDMQHVFNNHTWSGYFVYTAEETFYVVYDHLDFIPTLLIWVEWREGKKQSLNSLRFQYGAAEYLKMDVASFVEHARRNQPTALIWSCEVYHYDESHAKILTADSFHHSPGLGFFKERKIYTYSSSGKLETIRSESVQPDTSIEAVIKFSRAPKGETLRSLTENLAERISNIIMEALLQSKSVNPIMQVELYYRAVDRYIPTVMYATEEEVEKFEHSTIYDLTARFFGFQWMKHELNWEMDAETEQLYVRFFSRIRNAENWTAGENMMYLIVKKICAKALASGEEHISNNFFSYALDYEIDASELDKILIKCGVSKKQVADWKKAGCL